MSGRLNSTFKRKENKRWLNLSVKAVERQKRADASPKSARNAEPRALCRKKKPTADAVAGKQEDIRKCVWNTR